MGRFSQVAENTFNELQVEAGVLLKDFDPANPELVEENIICATTGGINPACVPTYSDYFADIDNAPNNTKEGKHLDGWDCTLGFTALNTTPDVICMALGAADVEMDGKITPRAKLADGDFKDVWWVGDRSDGGCVAICLRNALSTSGFSLQTSKNGKGQIAVTLSGHISMNDQSKVPMEFYVSDGE